MKKLFSLLIVALISSQMWAYSYAYASFGSGCSSTMGSIFVSTSSTSFSSTSASNSNSTTYYWKAEAKSGYKFVGWYTSSTKPSSWTAYGASTSNPYSKFVSSSTTLYFWKIP